MAGVLIGRSVSTRNGPSVLSAGTGTLTIWGSRDLVTTNQLLTITADNIDIDGTSRVITGTAALVLHWP